MNDMRFDTVYSSVPERTHLRLVKALEEKTNVNTKKISHGICYDVPLSSFCFFPPS